jgi:excisionase family DNA binding protein
MSNASLDSLLSELVNRVADAVAERLSCQETKTTQDDGLKDEPWMAHYLDVSQPTLQRMRSAGEVPFIRLGRRVAYHPPTVLAALSRKSQNKEGGGRSDRQHPRTRNQEEL